MVPETKQAGCDLKVRPRTARRLRARTDSRLGRRSEEPTLRHRPRPMCVVIFKRSDTPIRRMPRPDETQDSRFQTAAWNLFLRFSCRHKSGLKAHRHRMSLMITAGKEFCGLFCGHWNRHPVNRCRGRDYHRWLPTGWPGAVARAPAPTERSVQISRTTLVRSCFTARR